MSFFALTNLSTRKNTNTFVLLNSSSRFDKLTIIIILILSLLFMFLAVFKPIEFRELSQEDNIIEWGSVILLFGSSIVFIMTWIKKGVSIYIFKNLIYYYMIINYGIHETEKISKYSGKLYTELKRRNILTKLKKSGNSVFRNVRSIYNYDRYELYEEFGLQSFTEFHPENVQWGITGFYARSLNEYLSTKVTYTVDNFSYYNFLPHL